MQTSEDKLAYAKPVVRVYGALSTLTRDNGEDGADGLSEAS
jgi:hypothetical protein